MERWYQRSDLSKDKTLYKLERIHFKDLQDSIQNLLNFAATFFISRFPKRTPISRIASASSAELKKGNRPDKMEIRITPTDQISKAWYQKTINVSIIDRKQKIRCIAQDHKLTDCLTHMSKKNLGCTESSSSSAVDS